MPQEALREHLFKPIFITFSIRLGQFAILIGLMLCLAVDCFLAYTDARSSRVERTKREQKKEIQESFRIG